MTDTAPHPPTSAPAGATPPPRTDAVLGVGATAGFLALALSVLALLFWLTDDRSTTTTTGGAPSQAHVVLTEFAIEPPDITVAAGGSLHVQNDGSVPHNLAVEGTDLKTADLMGGESEELSVAALAPGRYTVVCLIPGHADAGMRASLVVAEGGATGGTAAPTTEGSTEGEHAGHTPDEWAQMQEAMLASMNAFPAATEGVGNEPLEPTEILADGTKVFDLVAAITPWEVAPGQIVEAWTYNGTVPGPSIHLEVGERAHIRVTNELPHGTDLHMHGLNVENRFDGVAPYTQELIEPGETFTYEYVADEPAVAMYHPHFMSQIGMPNGMFGTIFVGDMRLPVGRTVGDEVIPADLEVSQEIPMVLNDSGVIGYSLNGKSFPATAPIVANEGDWVLIHYFNEGTQIHPMHLHQFDQIVIAKDGFPVDAPYVADVVNVAPGERYTVLVQLDRQGTWVYHCHILPHVEKDDGMFGMVTAVIVE